MLTTAKSIQLLDASGLNISPITDITSLYYETTDISTNMVVRKYVYTGFPVAVNINQKIATINVSDGSQTTELLDLNYDEKLIKSGGGDILVSNVSTSILPGTTYRQLDITNYNLSEALFNYAPKKWVKNTFDSIKNNFNSSFQNISNNILNEVIIDISNNVNSSIIELNGMINSINDITIPGINNRLDDIDASISNLNTSLNDIYSGNIETKNISYFYTSDGSVQPQVKPNTFYYLNYNDLSSSNTCANFNFDCSLLSQRDMPYYDNCIANIKLLVKTNGDKNLDKHIYGGQITYHIYNNTSRLNPRTYNDIILSGTYTIIFGSKIEIRITRLKDKFGNTGSCDFISPLYRIYSATLGQYRHKEFIQPLEYGNGRITNNIFKKPIIIPYVKTNGTITISNNYIDGNISIPLYDQVTNQSNTYTNELYYNSIIINNNIINNNSSIVLGDVKYVYTYPPIAYQTQNQIVYLSDNIVDCDSKIFFDVKQDGKLTNTSTRDVSFYNNIVYNSNIYIYIYNGNIGHNYNIYDNIIRNSKNSFTYVEINSFDLQINKIIIENSSFEYYIPHVNIYDNFICINEYENQAPANIIKNMAYFKNMDIYANSFSTTSTQN